MEGGWFWLIVGLLINGLIITPYNKVKSWIKSIASWFKKKEIDMPS